MDTDYSLALNLTDGFDADEVLSIIFNLSVCYPDYKLHLEPIKREQNYRVVKWKKAWYKDLNKLYQDNNLIKTDDTGTKSCDPSSVVIHMDDARLLKKTIMDVYKKECPYASKKTLAYSVGLYLLNLEPKIDSKEVKSGYIKIIEGTVE